MFNTLISHMVIDDIPNYLLPIPVRNLNQIPTLYQRLLLLMLYISLLSMYKVLCTIHPSIAFLENHVPMALSLIIEDHILDILIIRIGIHAYLLLPLVYLILLNKKYKNVNLMVSTQLLTYFRNHLYLPHLDLLLYFTPDNHNSELVLWHLLQQPTL